MMNLYKRLQHGGMNQYYWWGSVSVSVMADRRLAFLSVSVYRLSIGIKLCKDLHPGYPNYINWADKESWTHRCYVKSVLSKEINNG